MADPRGQLARLTPPGSAPIRPILARPMVYPSPKNGGLA